MLEYSPTLVEKESSNDADYTLLVNIILCAYYSWNYYSGVFTVAVHFFFLFYLYRTIRILLLLQYIFTNRLVLYKKRVNEFHTNSFHTDVHGIIPSKPPIIPTFSCKIVLSLDSMFHHRT